MPVGNQEAVDLAEKEGFVDFNKFASKLAQGEGIKDMFEKQSSNVFFRKNASDVRVSPLTSWVYNESLKQYYTPSKLVHIKQKTISDKLREDDQTDIAQAFDDAYAEFNNQGNIQIFQDERKEKQRLERDVNYFLAGFTKTEDKVKRHKDMEELERRGSTSVRASYKIMLTKEFEDLKSAGYFPLDPEAKPMETRDIKKDAEIYANALDTFDDQEFDDYIDERVKLLEIGEDILAFKTEAIGKHEDDYGDLETHFRNAGLPTLWNNKYKLLYQAYKKTCAQMQESDKAIQAEREKAASDANAAKRATAALAKKTKDIHEAKSKLSALEQQAKQAAALAEKAAADKLAAEKLAQQAAEKLAQQAAAIIIAPPPAINIAPPPSIHPMYRMPTAQELAITASKEIREAAGEDAKNLWLFPQTLVNFFMYDEVPKDITADQRANMDKIKRTMKELSQEVLQDPQFRDITPKVILTELIKDAVMRSRLNPSRIKNFMLKEMASEHTPIIDNGMITPFGNIVKALGQLNFGAAYTLWDLGGANSNDLVKEITQVIMPIIDTDDETAVQNLVKTTFVLLLTRAGHFCDEKGQLPQEVLYEGYGWDFNKEFLLTPVIKQADIGGAQIVDLEADEAPAAAGKRGRATGRVTGGKRPRASSPSGRAAYSPDRSPSPPIPGVGFHPSSPGVTPPPERRNLRLNPSSPELYNPRKGK